MGWLARVRTMHAFLPFVESELFAWILWNLRMAQVMPDRV